METTPVPVRDTVDETVDLAAFQALACAPEEQGFKAKLLAAKSGSYLGQIQGRRGLVNCVIIMPAGVDNLNWIEKKSPGTTDRMVKLWKIIAVNAGGKMTESK